MHPLCERFPFLNVISTCRFPGTHLWHGSDAGTEVPRTSPHARTCVPKPVEAAAGSLGDLSVGGGRVGAAGVAGRRRGVHLWLPHVEEAHIQLEVAAPTGLSHVGAERGLWGERAEGSWSCWPQVSSA